MNTLWKMLLILAIAYAAGGTLRHEATPHQAAPVRSAGTTPEDVCAAEAEAVPKRGHMVLAGHAEGRSSESGHSESTRPDGESRIYLANSRFAEVLGKHDAFLPHLARWRRLLAAHAPALARLVKTFPSTESLSEERIREVLRSPSGLSPEASRGDVFRPWAARWSGPWGDGSPQYHIWDPSHCHAGRQVQRVAQSETAFPEAARLETMVRRNQADLAVNVFSERFGVTGWVSKRQHGPREIPCLGYLIKPTVLLWVCQTSGRLQKAPTPKALALKTLARDGWFAYLESVEALADSPVYHIYGHAFEITRRGIRYGAFTSLHTGHYRSK